MRARRQVITVGSTTHGSISWAFAHVLLPCGLVAVISSGRPSLRDVTGRLIEGNGIVPDIYVEPTIEDFLAGRDPVIDKAVEVLQKAMGEQE